MRKLTLLALASLTGCVSTANVLTKAPSETIMSAKSQAEVAFCLADKWNTAALDHPSGAKVIMVKGMYGEAVGSISVFANGSGSRTEFRKGGGLGFPKVRRCF
jgi:hypothetical protein